LLSGVPIKVSVVGSANGSWFFHVLSLYAD
jgi:hypothetical protein